MNKLGPFLLSILALLPLSVLYWLSNAMYYILYYLLSYRLKVVKTNLQNAFPDKSIAERKIIVKKFYRHLADLMVETIKMKTISKQEILRRMKIVNPEELLQYLNKNESVLIVTSHYGNWEWGIPRLALLSDTPSLIIYKPLSNSYFGKMLNAMRTRFGGVMVPMRNTIRKIIEYKDQVHVSVFLGDQTPTRSGSDYFINFLNQPTLVFKGIEKIAKRTNNPVVFCHISPIKRGYFQVKFTTLVAQPKDTLENEITLIHNRFLEDIINQRPEFWLWSHKRWKHKPNHE